MKTLIGTILCALTILSMTSEAKAYYYVRPVFMGYWDDGVLAYTTGYYATLRGPVAVGHHQGLDDQICVSSSISTNCNLTIQIDVLNESSDWKTNQKWFVMNRNLSSCGWVGDTRLDSYGWWYIQDWEQPSSLYIQRYSNFTRMHTSGYFSNTNFKECFYDNMGTSSFTSYVFPTAELQFQKLNQSTWGGVQFGVYMPVSIYY